jgi:hypothetical protein
MKNDVRDVPAEGWAEVVEDLLRLASPDQRVAILELALENERKAAAERAEDADRAARGEGFRLHTFDEASWQAYLKSASHRHWNDIMLIEAVAAYTFIRHVTNNNSPANARTLLLRQHREAPGSGYLEEYLDGILPKPQRRRGQREATS